MAKTVFLFISVQKGIRKEKIDCTFIIAKFEEFLVVTEVASFVGNPVFPFLPDDMTRCHLQNFKIIKFLEKLKMNCMIEVRTVAEYPFVFLFNAAALVISLVLRWALRSFYVSLSDINKNINTFLNIYIIEFLNAMILIAVGFYLI